MRQASLGLIETLRVRDERIPFIERHLARLEHAIAQLQLPRPSRDVRALVTPFQAMGDAVVRAEVCDGRVTVTVRELPSLAAPAVITASQPHVPYPQKTTLRDCFDEAADEALIAEADDALLLTHDGSVAEGTVWSLFWWDEQGLCTPALGLGILPGVGRARVLELAEVNERSVPRAALDGKSLLLVNSVRGVIPLALLDGAPVPEDVRTQALMQRFWP
jgi:branched-subunit amino acid aminotransferase/4-amino-4-deoxychorismate lyase